VSLPAKKSILFIDGQNLFYAAKEAFGYTYPNYDPKKLAGRICQQEGWQLAEARFYTGVPDQYRLLYFFAGKRIVITHGFIKKTGPVPVSELDRAERLMQEWHQHGI
jgi:hypothetical protein